MAEATLKLGLDLSEVNAALNSVEDRLRRAAASASNAGRGSGGGTSAAQRAEQETLRLAQAQARLQATTGNLTGAQTTLQRALSAVNEESLATIRAQTQLAAVQGRLQRESEGVTTAFIRVKHSVAAIGPTAQGSSRIAREAFITASSEIIESWGVDGDIANELGRMLYNLPVQAKIAAVGIVGAFVVAGAAIAAIVIATNEMLETAKRVGTDSKEDFEKFAKGVRDAGGEVTILDRKLSQELTRSADQVKGALDLMLLNLLRQSGPELLVLLQNTAKFLNELAPVAQKFGSFLSGAFNVGTAAMRTFIQTRQLLASSLIGGPGGIGTALGVATGAFSANLAQVEKEAAEAQGKIGNFKLTGFKGKGAGEPSEFKKLSDELAGLNKQLAIFTDTTSKEFKLKVRIDDAQQLKSNIEELVRLRRENGQDPQTAFATTFDKRGREVLDPAGIKIQLDFQRNLRKEFEETARAVERLGEQLQKNNAIKLVSAVPEGLREEILAEAKLLDVVRDSQARVNLETVEAKVVTSKYFEELLKLNPTLAENIRLQASAVDATAARNNSLDSLSKLTQKLNDDLVDFNNLSREQQTIIELQGDAYNKLTAAEKQSAIELARNVDAVTANRRAMEEFAQVTEGLFNTLIDRGPRAFFDELLSIGKRTLARLLTEFIVFGNNANNAAGSGIGGFLSKLFGGGGSGASSGGGGGILGGLFGGGGGGVFRTPSFNPSSGGNFLSGLLGGGITAPNSITPTFVGGLPTFGNVPVPLIGGGGLPGGGGLAGLFGKGGSFLSNIFSGAGGALLPFLGAGLGSGLGGQSTLGRILGGIGGGAVGLGVSFGASVFGALGGGFGALGPAALAALGPAALIGAPLLIGALLLGRAKARRQDEATSGDSLQRAIDQIKDLKRQADSGQLTSIAEAESSFTAIHRQFINETLQLKTRSVRESRLNNQGDITPPLHPDSLRLLFEREALPAIIAANTRRGVFDKLIPEFATGGAVPRTGLIFAHERELVLNQRQQRDVLAMAGRDVFRAAGVPNAPVTTNYGGRDTGGSGAPAPVILKIGNVTLNISKEEAGRIVAEGLETSDGRQATVDSLRDAVRNGRV